MVNDFQQTECVVDSKDSKPTFTELKFTERSRKYVYGDGTFVEFKDVVRISVRPSGTHRLETKDGRRIIVISGWKYIELDVDDWTL